MTHTFTGDEQARLMNILQDHPIGEIILVLGRIQQSLLRSVPEEELPGCVRDIKEALDGALDELEGMVRLRNALDEKLN